MKSPLIDQPIAKYQSSGGSDQVEQVVYDPGTAKVAIRKPRIRSPSPGGAIPS
ncbi:MAG: hypothetical protein FJ042_07280 [Candidatus Cloacimonetes bacterium]|nr:hypothetical protein [Candidatus Cloacimonadota bacterium]